MNYNINTGNKMINYTEKQLYKFQILMLKAFDKANDCKTVEEISCNFLLSGDNTIGIEIKDKDLMEVLLPYYSNNITRKPQINYMDEDGSFFDFSKLNYCIKLIKCFENKKSVEVKSKCIYLNTGRNKPIILENDFIKITLCNCYLDEVY